MRRKGDANGKRRSPLVGRTGSFPLCLWRGSGGRAGRYGYGRSWPFAASVLEPECSCWRWCCASESHPLHSPEPRMRATVDVSAATEVHSPRPPLTRGSFLESRGSSPQVGIRQKPWESGCRSKWISATHRLSRTLASWASTKVSAYSRVEYAARKSRSPGRIWGRANTTKILAVIQMPRSVWT